MANHLKTEADHLKSGEDQEHAARRAHLATAMADHVKSEEDQQRDARRAHLYSIPAYKPANEAMPANGTKRKRGSETEEDSEESSGERPRPGNTLRIPGQGPRRLRLIGPKPPIRPKRLKLIGPRPGNIPRIPAQGPRRLRLIGPKPPIRPKRLKLIGPKPPIRQINTILTIPGTDRREYKRGGITYVCPKGIEPWTPEHRWMLDPR